MTRLKAITPWLIILLLVCGGATTFTLLVPITDGGTGATTASGARTNLGVEIGTNVQAYDADLTTWAAITPSANIQTFLGAANYAAARTSLGAVGGSTGSTDNALLRADGTGGATAQAGSDVLLNDAGMLQFGGTTASFVGLKRTNTTLLLRLADDSAPAFFNCAGIGVTGDIVASGDGSFNAITGDGSGITSIDADHITSGTLTADRLPNADTDAFGALKVAVAADVNTGTDTDRAITPDALRGSDYGKKQIAMVVPGTITTGSVSGANPICGPYTVPSSLNGWDVVAVRASVMTGSTSGNPTFQVRRLRRSSATASTGANVLSTALTIDAAGTPELRSVDAATAAVIDTSNDDLATDDQLYLECSTAGTGTAYLGFTITIQKP